MLTRYFAIKHPVLHVTLLNASKAKVAVVLTWVLSFIVGILPLLGWNSISSVESIFNFIFVYWKLYNRLFDNKSTHIEKLITI